MDDKLLTQLYTVHRRTIEATSMKFVRNMMEQIDWEDRLIGIKGARGVGKTTLILQHIKQTFGNDSVALYTSLDDMRYATLTLQDVAEYHYTHGGRYLYLDEVHKYPHWQTTLKNLYDSYPDMKIAYTASSMLEIDSRQGDLSRRQMVYRMPGLSFREYLEFEKGIQLSALTLDELLKRHAEVCGELSAHTTVLPLFERYLHSGYYPFYKSTRSGFEARLQEVIRQILENDLTAVHEVQYATITKLKKMLMVLAERVPQTPNMNELYHELETNREQGLRMIHLLEQAELIALLSKPTKSLKQMSKPSKIYLDNANLMYALTPMADIGTLRETFFYNQVRAIAEVTLPEKGDFKVGDHWLFEVGGRSKTFDQIKDEPNSYLAIDGIECGHHNRIALYAFGLMY